MQVGAPWYHTVAVKRWTASSPTSPWQWVLVTSKRVRPAVARGLKNITNCCVLKRNLGIGLSMLAAKLLCGKLLNLNSEQMPHATQIPSLVLFSGWHVKAWRQERDSD